DKNNQRVIHYIKTDEDHKQVEVILNCSEDSIVVERKGNELFSLLNEDTILKPKGVFIQQI
ncbi:MAG TPA: alpha-glycosidase, partial [Lachnoclostridium phytofermentans]|nr:alpha-glycosidase [Lachnoclostridium phytofermentans]